MDEYPWPQTCAGPLVSAEICHALGVLVVNWNICETAEIFLLGMYLGNDGDLILGPMPSNTRATLLADIVHRRESRDDLVREISHFQTCYAICLENRNTIIHSVAVPEDYLQGNPLTFRKEPKRPHHGKAIVMPGDAVLIARTAREISRVYGYGMRLFLCKARGEREPLPDRPPLPRKLSLARPTGQNEPPRPPSSQA